MNAFPNPNNTEQTGMSLRDYFAAQALQGLIANGDAANEYSTARIAYGFANAMMEVRDEDNE